MSDKVIKEYSPFSLEKYEQIIELAEVPVSVKRLILSPTSKR